MNTYSTLRAGLFFAIIIGCSAVSGYGQTRLDGEWSGWGNVTLRSSPSGYSGTYTDTYGTGKGSFTFYRVADRQFTGTWGESTKRHGTFTLRLSADGKAMDVTWKADANCEIYPGNGGVSLWTRTSPVYNEVKVPVNPPAPPPTPKPEPVRDTRDCERITERLNAINAELQAINKEAERVAPELAKAMTSNAEWRKGLAEYKRGLSQRIDFYRREVARTKQALKLAKERVNNLEINPNPPDTDFWRANMKAAVARVAKAEKNVETAEINLADMRARLRNADKITADKQKLVDYWQEKLNDLSVQARKLAGEARVLKSLYEDCR